jgi:hypothetical protein
LATSTSIVYAVDLFAAFVIKNTKNCGIVLIISAVSVLVLSRFYGILGYILLNNFYSVLGFALLLAAGVMALKEGNQIGGTISHINT